MALLESKLATELEVLTPTTDAAQAVLDLADAYGNYFADAESNSITILTVSAAVTAMSGAMSFPLPGSAAAGAASISAGVAAFWAVLVAAPAAHFTGATLIVIPTGLAGLTAALTSAIPTTVGLTTAQGAAIMAADMHAASIGPVAGNATFPGPAVHDIT